jgi:hypothetical protein
MKKKKNQQKKIIFSSIYHPSLEVWNNECRAEVAHQIELLIYKIVDTVNQHPPHSAAWRMDGKWWWNSFLLCSTSLLNYGG